MAAIFVCLNVLNVAHQDNIPCKCDMSHNTFDTTPLTILGMCKIRIHSCGFQNYLLKW